MKKHSKAQIEGTAEAIAMHFIPKEKDAQAFSFHFTIPPSFNYKANYQRAANGDWKLISCEADETES
jgi:hypothetical protein